MRELSLISLVVLLIAVVGVSSLHILREGYLDNDAPPVIPSLAPSAPSAPLPSLSVSSPSAPPLSVSAPSCSQEQSAAQETQKRASLLRDIRQVVHNEMMRDRSMTTASSQPLFQTESKESALLSNDPSLLQGQEHSRATRPTYCPKDMNEYIRKDSIPCYACTLDY